MEGYWAVDLDPSNIYRPQKCEYKAETDRRVEIRKMKPKYDAELIKMCALIALGVLIFILIGLCYCCSKKCGKNKSNEEGLYSSMINEDG